MKDGIRIRGFARVQIIDKKTGKVVGDSGWGKNTVTNYGLNNCFAGAAIGQAASAQIVGAQLATQTLAMNATHISLIGTENAYKTVSPSTVATGTARVTCSFDGSDNSATITVGAVGVHSNTNVATNLIAGKTFTTSQFATNQQINLTYEWQLA